MAYLLCPPVKRYAGYESQRNAKSRDVLTNARMNTLSSYLNWLATSCAKIINSSPTCIPLPSQFATHPLARNAAAIQRYSYPSATNRHSPSSRKTSRPEGPAATICPKRSRYTLSLILLIQMPSAKLANRKTPSRCQQSESGRVSS